MTIRRYMFDETGTAFRNVSDRLNPAATVDLVGHSAPNLVIDLSLARGSPPILPPTAEDVAELDQIMADLGWHFVEEAPADSPAHAVVTRQTGRGAVVTDASTSLLNWTDVPGASVDIVADTGSRFELAASVASTLIGTKGFFRFALDGVPIAFSSVGRSLVGTMSTSLLGEIVALAPGPRKVTLQWRIADPLTDTLLIRAVSEAEQENATLFVREVWSP